MKKITNEELKKLEDLYKSNNFVELEKKTKKFLEIENDNVILLNILGVIYLKKELFSEAENIFKKILAKNPKEKNSLKNLGEIYRKTKKINLAIEFYERYLLLNKNDSEVINNIASCYLKNKRYSLAVSYYKSLVEKNPENDEYSTNLAISLIESLNFNEGINLLEKLLNKNINNRRALSGYLFNQNYNPKINQEKINNYIKKFSNLHKKKINISNYCFDKKAKKLIIGFVSPDFRNHPVGYALANVIKNLKSYNFILHGYYNFTLEDELTNKFKKDFDNFYNITNLTDEQIVNKVRSEGTHILIDLSGYTFNNRLSIFFYNPAPIQISWLGYLPTTGIKEINYKIGDNYIYPESIEKNFTEKILKFSHIWSDFTVKENIEIKHKESDEITFGCFVTLRKINDEVINLWSKVLKKFSNSKIYFKSNELNDSSIMENLINKFKKHGIKTNQLILEKSSDYKTYLESYSKVDITLDPFPWNGVTTSFESIWMGVPIFCLKGHDLPYSRCSYSINKNLKMESWIALDEVDYLIKLEKILSNRQELLKIKKNLRNHAIKNNLFNSNKLSKDLAKLLNEVWNNFIMK